MRSMGRPPSRTSSARRARRATARSAGESHEDVVAQKGAEQSKHDGHLLQRAEPPTHVGRGHFRDVHRSQDARRTDRHTADEPCGNEDSGGVRQAAGKCADEEEHGVQQHRRPPTITVGHGPRDEGTDRAADQHRRHGKARGRRPSAKGMRQRVDGPVDDAAVETEEEASDGGDRAQHDDVGRALRRRLSHRRRVRCIQDAVTNVSVHHEAPRSDPGARLTS